MTFVVALACGGSSTPISPSPIPSVTATTSPTIPGSPIAHQLTYVVINQSIQGDYGEQVRSFAQIAGAGTQRTYHIGSSGSRLLDLHRAGQYTIRSYQQPC